MMKNKQFGFSVNGFIAFMFLFLFALGVVIIYMTSGSDDDYEHSIDDLNRGFDFYIEQKSDKKPLLISESDLLLFACKQVDKYSKKESKFKNHYLFQFEICNDIKKEFEDNGALSFEFMLDRKKILDIEFYKLKDKKMKKEWSDLTPSNSKDK